MTARSEIVQTIHRQRIEARWALGQGTVRIVMDGISALNAFLAVQPAGPVQDTNRLVQLLTACWHEFDGSVETNMHTGKLCRIEQPEWHPPTLSFWIERHGQTVMGSKRASLFQWCLDVEIGTASIAREKKRQLTPNDKPLDVKPIAASLANAIIEGRSDDRFKLLSDGKIRIQMGRVIPETNAQTTTARRKRLRRELTSRLEAHGWREVAPNLYAPA